MKSLILIILFTISALALPVSAQSETDLNQDQAPEIKDVPGLRAEFKQYTQDPESKEIKFEMILKSNLDSDRVRVTWTLTTLSGRGAVFKTPTEATRNIEIEKGQTYTIPITVVPTGQGAIELLGTVESFKADATFTVTVKKIFGTNASLEVLPITQEYIQARTMVIIRNIVIFAALFVAITVFGLKGLKRFSRWLNEK